MPHVSTTKCRKNFKFLLMLALGYPAAIGEAQDISPVITSGQAAEGIYYRSMMEEQAERDRQRQSVRKPTPATPEFQRQACANRPLFRKQYGANHPKVLQLESLCAKAGY